MKEMILQFTKMLIIAICLLFSLNQQAYAQQNVTALDKEEMRSDLHYLTSPELQGRDVPGETGDMAAKWVSEKLKNIGMKPAFTDSAFLQQVPLLTADLDTQKTSASFVMSDRKIDLKWGKDYYFLPRTPTPKAYDFSLSYCSYGIEDQRLARHDFQNLKTGQAAVVRAGSGELSPQQAGRHRLVAFKAASARRQGAECLIVLYPNDQWNVAEEITGKLDEVFQLKVGLQDQEPAFPVVYMRATALTEAGIDIEKLDGSAKISFKLQSAFYDQKVQHGLNVCAVIPGETDKYVVVGAHYDHLGVKEILPNGEAIYYPGADDNASGVTGLLQICRMWQRSPIHKQGLIAVSFTAEEDGLLGAKYFADNLPIPVEKITAMVNLDMIGRDGFASMRDAKMGKGSPDPLYASLMYSAASPEMRNVLQATAKLSPLAVELSAVGGFPYTDAGEFQRLEIPSVHLFSGFQSDYSGLGDTPDKINWDKLGNMSLLGYQILANLSEHSEPLGFDRTIKTSGHGMKY